MLGGGESVNQSIMSEFACSAESVNQSIISDSRMVDASEALHTSYREGCRCLSIRRLSQYHVVAMWW